MKRFGGVPPYRETRRYVEKVLALLSEAETGGRQEELWPSPGPALVPVEAGGVPAGGGVLGSGLEVRVPEGCALGLARSAAVRTCLAAFRVAESLLRPGEVQDDESGWRA